MINKPKVSIVIPTYNRANLLIKALESCINQTYKNIEIIISDNCSSDETQEICSAYVNKDSRIKYYRQEENIGIGANAKFLLNQATGEYSCVLNDDDYLSDNYVEECLNAIVQNDVLCSFATVLLIDEDNNIQQQADTFIAIQEDSSDRVAQYFKNGFNNFIFSAFTKTEIYKKCYVDYDKDRFCEDQIGVIKFLCEGKFVSIKEANYYKLNNGCTKDLETLKRTFNMTNENFFHQLIQTHIDAILTDDYYKNNSNVDVKKIIKLLEKIDNVSNKKKPKNILKKFKNLFSRKSKVKKKTDNVEVGENTILLNKAAFRYDVNSNNKVKIGSDCMINCNFIFESDKGEIEIGNRTFINAGVNLISRSKISIGDDVTIAFGVTIYDHNSHSLDWRERANDIKQQMEDYTQTGNFIQNKNWEVVKSRPIKICDKVWIGMNCTILNGVTIGEGAIVGACSVVREDVEPWTVVGGNPAKVIRRLHHD